MKKHLSLLLIVAISLCLFTACNSNDETSDTSIKEDSKTEYIIDYFDADSFESALNNGTDVTNKIVQFYVNDYKPDSALGINTWAGEHLNFISEEELDVEEGDYVIGLVTSEPTKTFLGGSWKIPYEVLDIRSKPIEKDLTPATKAPSLETKPAATDILETSAPVATPPAATKPATTPPTAAKPATTPPAATENKATEPENNSSTGNSVYYSTNTSENVKNGNTGVYAYKSTGGSYDIYWIIDFDNSYVYWFTDGNGDDHCDRLKIESGDLNSVLIITYHDSGTEWSNGLHFKYKNQPSKLIMQDQNGFEYDYSPTSLADALSIRNSKSIIDY